MSKNKYRFCAAAVVGVHDGFGISIVGGGFRTLKGEPPRSLLMPLYWQSNEETALLCILLIAAIPDHQMVGHWKRRERAREIEAFFNEPSEGITCLNLHQNAIDLEWKRCDHLHVNRSFCR